MNRTVLSRRITRIQSDIEKLSNTLCAMDKTDIETYPENYEMLSTDAALRSELITCKVRHLIYSSTGLKKGAIPHGGGDRPGYRYYLPERPFGNHAALPASQKKAAPEYRVPH